MNFESFLNVLVPEGTYEAVLSAKKYVSGTSGKETLLCAWYIRKDIPEQSYGGSVVKQYLPHEKVPQEAWFNFRKSAIILASQKNKPNYKMDFATPDLFIQHINGINAKINVLVEEYTDPNDGITKKRNRIDEYKIMPSTAATLGYLKDYIKPEDEPQAAPVTKRETEDVLDSDLPF